MVNSIYKKQNELIFLKYIGAQRKAYYKAKIISLWKDIIILVFALLSVIASLVELDTLTAIVFFVASIVPVVSKYIDKSALQHKQSAAMTQQYIDVSLFNFVLKDDIHAWGKLLSKSELAEIAGTISKNDIKGTKNWYGDYSVFTPLEQVYYCQRENLRWDAKLRRDFKNLILIFVAVIALLLLIAVFVINPTVIRLLCITSWLVPLGDFACSYYVAIKKDIVRLEKMRKMYIGIEEKISKTDMKSLQMDSFSYKLIRSHLIELQYNILNHRKESFLVPSWFYKLRQNKYQKNEDKIANEMRHLLKDGDKINKKG